MSQESSVPPGPSGSALTGTDFHVLIKESLLEVLQENPQLLQTSVAAYQHSQRSISGELFRVPIVLLWLHKNGGAQPWWSAVWQRRTCRIHAGSLSFSVGSGNTRIRLQ